MSATLHAALANRFTLATFATLTKHDKAGRFNRDAALRLLRNNVRDVDRHASAEQQQRIAIALLTHWLQQRNASGHTTE